MKASLLKQHDESERKIAEDFNETMIITHARNHIFELAAAGLTRGGPKSQCPEMPGLRQPAGLKRIPKWLLIL
jgi:hypothetical protein